jgi:3-isopropylmalate/(R)-2-methylmalate dehydratase small subunit
MRPFTRLDAVAAPLRRLNVDTDAIIPGNQIVRMSVAKAGFGDGLFYNWRHRADGTEDPAFVLNRPPYRDAKILLAGHNFACGSSREVAVWALRDGGFRCVIAPSYGGIFYANCFKNGVLPVVLPEEEVERLCDEVEASQGRGHVVVDLEACTVTSPEGRALDFALPEIFRQALIGGLDPISATLRFSDDILAFQQQDRAKRPWAYFGGPGLTAASFQPLEEEP